MQSKTLHFEVKPKFFMPISIMPAHLYLQRRKMLTY